MAKVAAKAEISELKALRESLETLKDVTTEEMCTSIIKEIAARFLRGVMKKTPVQTGNLRRGWTASGSGGSGVSVRKTGNDYVVTISNAVEYAPYVEYGHRTRGGGWVDGNFMMTLTADEIEGIAPKLVEKRVTARMKEVFNP